jgi:hypothetical protein
MNSRSPLLLVMVERMPESKDILARLARSQLSARAAACLSASAFFLAVSASSAAFFLASSSFSLPALGSFFAAWGWLCYFRSQFCHPSLRQRIGGRSNICWFDGF